MTGVYVCASLLFTFSLLEINNDKLRWIVFVFASPLHPKCPVHFFYPKVLVCMNKEFLEKLNARIKNFVQLAK